MQIAKITISNWMGIKRLSIDSLGKINMIRGENGSGKTSFLEAITGAFISTGSDINVINNDADDGKAETLIELTDGQSVERLVSTKTNRVIVKDADGEKIDKAQTYLTELVGPNPFNYNPIQFAQAKGKKRNELFLLAIDFKIKKQSFKAILRKHKIDLALIEFDPDKIDFRCHGIELLDKIKSGVYDFRAIINKEVIRLTNALQQDMRDMPAGSEKDWTGFNVTKKTQELLDAKDEINNYKKLADAIIDEKADNDSRLKSIKTRTDTIERLRDEIAKLNNNINIHKTRIEEDETVLAEFETPEIESMQSTINEYNDSQDFIFKQREMAKRQETLNGVEKKHTALDDFYKKLDKEIPKQVLADAELPFEGLEFRDDNIFLNDIEIDKLSDSESLTFLIKVSEQLIGEPKIVCINGWEQCGRKTRLQFAKETKGNGIQYFITEVLIADETDDGHLRIESEGRIDG